MCNLFRYKVTSNFIQICISFSNDTLQLLSSEFTEDSLEDIETIQESCESKQDKLKFIFLGILEDVP